MRSVLSLLPAVLCLLSWRTGAMPPAREPAPDEESVRTEEFRLGVLFWHPSPNDFAALEGLRRGLADAGMEHSLEVRQAEQDVERARRILREFETEPVDLVFALGTRAALLAAEELEQIPVVFTAVTNPVEAGIVPSWAGSGRNLTGNSNWIQPQRLLNVFRLAVPDLRRLGVIRSRRSGVVSSAEVNGVREHLRGLEAPPLELVEEVVEDPLGLPRAVERLLDAGVQALWIPIDFEVYENLDRVHAALGERSLPLVSSSVKGAEAGAVAGVYADYHLLGRRAVVLARAILLQGREPWSLPIGTLRGSQVVVNLEAAHRLGYELPFSLLVLADRILPEPAPEEQPAEPRRREGGPPEEDGR